MFRILVIILLVFLDLVSKSWIYNYIQYNTFIEIAPFFDIAHIHNFGISFGFFSELQKPWLFIFISIIITIILVVFYNQSKNYIEKIGFVIIISGAISNIIDRINNGFVIDFLYFHYKDFYWPAFNFADIYITVGVFLIISQMIKDFKNRAK